MPFKKEREQDELNNGGRERDEEEKNISFVSDKSHNSNNNGEERVKEAFTW
jgi:hypothetical protein